MIQYKSGLRCFGCDPQYENQKSLIRQIEKTPSDSGNFKYPNGDSMAVQKEVITLKLNQEGSCTPLLEECKDFLRFDSLHLTIYFKLMEDYAYLLQNPENAKDFGPSQVKGEEGWWKRSTVSYKYSPMVDKPTVWSCLKPAEVFDFKSPACANNCQALLAQIVNIADDWDRKPNIRNDDLFRQIFNVLGSDSQANYLKNRFYDWSTIANKIQENKEGDEPKKEEEKLRVLEEEHNPARSLTDIKCTAQPCTFNLLNTDYEKWIVEFVDGVVGYNLGAMASSAKLLTMNMATVIGTADADDYPEILARGGVIHIGLVSFYLVLILSWILL